MSSHKREINVGHIKILLQSARKVPSNRLERLRYRQSLRVDADITQTLKKWGICMGVSVFLGILTHSTIEYVKSNKNAKLEAQVLPQAIAEFETDTQKLKAASVTHGVLLVERDVFYNNFRKGNNVDVSTKYMLEGTAVQIKELQAELGTGKFETLPAEIENGLAHQPRLAMKESLGEAIDRKLWLKGYTGFGKDALYNLGIILGFIGIGGAATIKWICPPSRRLKALNKAIREFPETQGKTVDNNTSTVAAIGVSP